MQYSLAQFKGNKINQSSLDEQKNAKSKSKQPLHNKNQFKMKQKLGCTNVV